MPINWFEILGAVLTCLGVLLISLPNIKGIYVMIAAQTCWILFAFFNENWWLLAQGVFLFAMNIFAIYSWKKKGVGI